MGVQIDGNNVLALATALKKASKRVRQGKGPVLVEALTFRMRGHEEASGTAYVPKSLFETWGKKDPISNYERFLLEESLLTPERIAKTRQRFEQEIHQAWEEAQQSASPTPEITSELNDVYAPSTQPLVAPEGSSKTQRFVDAISDGLAQSMEADPTLVVMGQDVAEYGGVFKVTQGLLERFGRERVRNTPICESAIVGIGLGLSLGGHAAVVEMQFADFVSCGFNQIVNNLAKTHYRWGHPVNVTVRMPTGAGMGAGPFHSQSNEAWFTHVPGIKVVYPSTPYAAKGLLTTSLREANPVLFFEHKLLYRSLRGEVPEAYYNLSLGKAHIARKGSKATLVTYGAAVHWCLELTEKQPDLDLEVIDLQTLVPGIRKQYSAPCAKPTAVWWCTRTPSPVASVGSSPRPSGNCASNIWTPPLCG